MFIYVGSKRKMAIMVIVINVEYSAVVYDS